MIQYQFFLSIFARRKTRSYGFSLPPLFFPSLPSPVICSCRYRYNRILQELHITFTPFHRPPGSYPQDDCTITVYHSRPLLGPDSYFHPQYSTDRPSFLPSLPRYTSCCHAIILLVFLSFTFFFLPISPRLPTLQSYLIQPEYAAFSSFIGWPLFCLPKYLDATWGLRYICTMSV